MEKYDLINHSELVIVMKDAHSVPEVWVKGEPIKLKKHVRFEWDTLDGATYGKTKYDIAHYDEDEKAHIQFSKTRLSNPFRED